MSKKLMENVLWGMGGSFLAGAMYAKLSYEVNAGTYDRVASLWFVAMVVIFEAGKNIPST